MSAAVQEKLYTPQDLLCLPETQGFELVEGRLQEKGMGAASSAVSVRLASRLLEFVERHSLGQVFDAECGYQCFPWAPKNVRKPDISFVHRSRMAVAPRGHIQIPPDLAVEVTSPNDLHTEVAIKVREYLQAGVRLVWVIDPESRTADVYRQDGTGAYLLENGSLEGEDVLPGFTCRLGDILPKAEPLREEEPV